MPEETIAIIPARGGSKRCPGKNVAKFKGKTLVAHTIEQATKAGVFDRIIVSTDDPQVISIASQYTVEIERRDEALSSDNSPLIDVLRQHIDKFKFSSDAIICLLLVTGPLRKMYDIIESFELFKNSDRKNSVVSVTENENPLEMSWKLKNGYLQPYFDNLKLKTTRKQDFAKSYRYNDAAIFDIASNFSNPDRKLFGDSPIPYIMPPERSINIDYEFQLKLVQLIGEYWDQVHSTIRQVNEGQ